MAFLIIVGNTLTIAALLQKKFRKRPHFLLINLAFADLLLGCVTTLYVIVKCRSVALSPVYNQLDVFASPSSVFHLAVISLERLHVTLRPFRHHQLSLKVYWVAIATPWILSSFMWIFGSVIRITSPRYFSRLGYSGITISIAISLLITCFSYILIWVKRRRSHMRTFRQNQEARFLRAILIVTAASFVTWVPFQFVYVPFLLSRSFIPLPANLFIKLLRFSNSFAVSTSTFSFLGFLVTDKLCLLY